MLAHVPPALHSELEGTLFPGPASSGTTMESLSSVDINPALILENRFWKNTFKNILRISNASLKCNNKVPGTNMKEGV